MPDDYIDQRRERRQHLQQLANTTNRIKIELQILRQKLERKEGWIRTYSVTDPNDRSTQSEEARRNEPDPGDSYAYITGRIPAAELELAEPMGQQDAALMRYTEAVNAHQDHRATEAGHSPPARTTCRVIGNNIQCSSSDTAGSTPSAPSAQRAHDGTRYDNHILYGAVFPVPRSDRVTHRIKLEEARNIALRDKPAWRAVSEDQGGSTERFKGRIIKQIPYDISGVEVINEGIGHNLEWVKVRVLASNLPSPAAIESGPDYYEGYMYKSLLVPTEELNSAPMQDPHEYTPEVDEDGDPVEETRQQRRSRIRAIHRSRLAQERTGEIPWQTAAAIDEPYDEPLYDTVRVALEVDTEHFRITSPSELYSNLINRGVSLILLSKNIRLEELEIQRLNRESFIFGQVSEVVLSERPEGPVKVLVQLDMKYIKFLIENQTTPFDVRTHRMYTTRNLFETLRCASDNIRNFQAGVDAYCGEVTGFNPSEEADKLEYLIGTIRRVFELNDVEYRESEDDTIEIGWDSSMRIVYMVSSVNGGTRMSDESLSVFDSDDVYSPRIMVYMVYAQDICTRVNGDWSFLRFITKWVFDGLVNIEPGNPGDSDACPLTAQEEFNETPVKTRTRYSMERLLIDSSEFRNEIHDTAMRYVREVEDLSDLDSLLSRLETPDNIFGEFLDRVDIKDIIKKTVECLENLTRKKLEEELGEEKAAELEAQALETRDKFLGDKETALGLLSQRRDDLNAGTEAGLAFLNKLPAADTDLDYQISPDERFNYVDALAGPSLPEIPTLSFPDNRQVVDLLEEFTTSIADALKEAVMSAVVDMTKTVINHYLDICNNLDKDATIGAGNINSQINPDKLDGLLNAVRNAGFEGINISDVFDDISSVLTPSEICLLFIGTPSVKILDLCLSILKTKSPLFYQRLGETRSAKKTKIKMFFNFIGEFIGATEFCTGILESSPPGMGCGGFDSYSLRRELLRERNILSDAEIEQQIEREKQRKRTTLNSLKKILKDGLTPENADQLCEATNNIVPQTDPTLTYMVENVTDTVYSGLVNISDKDLENVSNTFIKSNTKKQSFELAPSDTGFSNVDTMRNTQIKIIENLYNIDVQSDATSVDIWVEDKKCFSNLNEAFNVITEHTESWDADTKGVVKYFTGDDLENGFGIELPVIKSTSPATLEVLTSTAQTPADVYGMRNNDAATLRLNRDIKIIRTTLDKIESGGLPYLSLVDVDRILSSTGLSVDDWPEIVPQFPPGMIAALPDGETPIDLPTRKRKAWLIARLETLDRVKFYNDRRTFWRSLSSDNKDGLVQLVYSNTIQSTVSADYDDDPSGVLESRALPLEEETDDECSPPPESNPPPTITSNMIDNIKLVVYEEEREGAETTYVKQYERQTKVDTSTDVGRFIKSSLLEGYEEYKSSTTTDTTRHLTTQQYSLAKMIKRSFSDGGYRLQDDPRNEILEKLGYYSQTLVMNRVSFEIAEKLRQTPFFKTLNFGTSDQASSSTPIKKSKDYIIEHFDFSRKKPPCPDQEPVDYLGVRKEQQSIISEASSLCANSEKGDNGYTDSQVSFIKSIVRTTIRAHVLDYFFRNIFHFASFSYPGDRRLLSEFLLSRFEKDLAQMGRDYAANFYSFIDTEMTRVSEPETYKEIIKEQIIESMDHILNEFDKLYSFKNQSQDLKKELIRVYDVPKYNHPENHIIDPSEEGTYYYHNTIHNQTFPLFIEKYVKVSFWTPADPEWNILDDELKNISESFAGPKEDAIISEPEYMKILQRYVRPNEFSPPLDAERFHAPLGASVETATDDCGNPIEFNTSNVPSFKSVKRGNRLCLLLDRHTPSTPELADQEVDHPIADWPQLIDNYATRIEGVEGPAANFDTEILDVVESENSEISIRNKSFFVKSCPVASTGYYEYFHIFRPVPLFSIESSFNEATIGEIRDAAADPSTFTLEGNIQEFYNSDQYKALFDFTFPIDSVVSLYSIMTMMNSTSSQEIATNFRPTKGSLKGLFDLLSSNDQRGYTYTDPALAAIGGQDGLRKLSEDLTTTSSYNIKDTIEMNPGLGLEFITKAIWKATKTILKNQAETRDPNIRLSKSIQDAALKAGAEIPILPISLIGLLPSNIFIPFGWGPPIGGLGFAYHALGLGYFKSGDSQLPAAQSESSPLEEQLSNSGIEIKRCPSTTEDADE